MFVAFFAACSGEKEVENSGVFIEQKLNEFIVVDYDKKQREWYVTYVNDNKILSCTINDIDSSYSIAKF